ncbi:MAG: AAA family ATPase [Candidatus Kerfeldbacteria bacterium]|nr:AAA family ATPase [Candidatus Kerfeldbacteria bacterium]
MTGKVIIIRGPLGVGKSTIGRHLAADLSSLYVPLDDVLADHGLDRVPADAECIPAENFLLVLRSLLPKLQQTVAAGQSVVVDACFYHREMIQFLDTHFPGQTAVFTLSAPVEICIARDRERSKSHGEDAARAVHDLVSRFTAGKKIDATKSKKSILQEIMKNLARGAWRAYERRWPPQPTADISENENDPPAKSKSFTRPMKKRPAERLVVVPPEEARPPQRMTASLPVAMNESSWSR